MNNYLFKAGDTSHGIYQTDIVPKLPNWSYSGLKIVKLSDRQDFSLATEDNEFLILPLEGSADVEVGSEKYSLKGRTTIFGEVTDYVFVPRYSQFTIKAHGEARFALPNALASETLAPRYCPSSEVNVTLRGAGNCSRQVVNYAIGNPLSTSRLLVCEVLTPGGNWSSYPPHKHDEETENEHELEEIYYFEIKANEYGPGKAFHATYGTSERPIQVSAQVETGDVALVPYGWHGPCVAEPGYDLYYLNVMAGPGSAEWKSVDDPCYGWVRDTWKDQQVDPRLPMKIKK